MKVDTISQIIRNRRSVFPNLFTGTNIDRQIIELLLEDANWAPTHRRTEPWRFIVFHRESARRRLGAYLGNWYRENTPAEQFSEMKWRKNREKPLQSACVIAICMQRDPEERVPEWEEIAAVSCAVQNLWLSASAQGLGGYWSSPRAMLEADDFLALEPGQRCLGIFYLGVLQPVNLPGDRADWQNKVRWAE